MDAKKHKCKCCKKLFERPSDLKRHYRIHTGEKAFTCDVCEKSFSQSGNLLIHKRIHAGKQPHQCNVCNKMFSQKCSLVRHERIHTGETPFVCRKCGKAFSNPYHLVCHNRTHSGQKPYMCSTCGKKFSQCSGLIAHKRTHTGEKLFKCNICGNVYSQASGLQKHKRTHSGEIFSCNICNQQFSKASNLMKHKITHNGGKYFDCHVQIRDVLPARNLLDHKGTHPGVNLFKFDIRVEVTKESYSDLLNETAPALSQKQSYPCELCERNFASSELLTLHKEFHTRQISSVVSPAAEQLECCLNIELEANRSPQTAPSMNWEESYLCDLCERVFASSELLTLHTESIHIGQQMDDVLSHEQVQHNLNNGLSLEADKQLVDNRLHKTTLAVSQEGSYKCDVCDKGFASSELLTLHKVSHIGQQMDNVVSHEQIEHCPNNGLDVDEGSIDTLHKEFHTRQIKLSVVSPAPKQLECCLDIELVDNRSPQTAPAMNREESYQCDSCERGKELLTLHKESHTGQEIDNVVSHEQVECNLNNGHETDKESVDNRLHQTTLAMSQDESHPCDLCERVFTSSELLTLHKDFHADDTEQQIMNDVVSLEQLEYYLDNGLEANEEPFDNRSHQAAQTMSREESCQCDLWDRFLASAELLTLHNESQTEQQMNDVVSHAQVEHHLNNGHEADKESFDDRSHQTLPSMSQEESYQCDLCKRIFESSRHLTLHKKFHHTLPQVSDVVSLIQSECHLDNELRGNEDPFGNVSHQTPLSVGQEDSYECDLSEIILASLELLALQKESIHTGQQINNLVSYEQLEYQLDNELGDNKKSYDSRLHHRAPAMMVKKESYQCNLCERNFVSSELLTLHKEFHTGQQISDVVYHEQLDYHLDNELDANEPSGITYICADCDEEFELADELFKHSEMAHAI